MIREPPPMLQHPDEFAQLLTLYRQRQPHHVLEVGTHQGGTLYHWLENAATNATIVTIDINHHQPDRYNDWAPPDVTIAVVPGDSHDPRTVDLARQHGPYDWLFIDADHYDGAVRQDWQLYSRLAAPGAIVALHDITPTSDPTIEVDRLWAELRDTHATLEITHPGGFGIGVVFMP